MHLPTGPTLKIPPSKERCPQTLFPPSVGFVTLSFCVFIRGSVVRWVHEFYAPFWRRIVKEWYSRQIFPLGSSPGPPSLFSGLLMWGRGDFGERL